MLDVQTSWYRILANFFRELPDRPTDVGDVGITCEGDNTAAVGDKGWPNGAVPDAVGLEGFDKGLGFGVESETCSSLFAMEADTSTTV